MVPVLGSKLLEFGLLCGSEHLHDGLAALLAVGNGLANLLNLLLLRITQVQLRKHLLHALAALPTLVPILSGTARLIARRSLSRRGSRIGCGHRG